jgi:hypothetical protein
MTRRQSNNRWSGGIAAHPAPPKKIPSAKIRWKISRFDFLRPRRNSTHSLSYRVPNYQRGVLFISAGVIEGHFEEKTPRRVKVASLERSCTCTTITRLTGQLNPEETGLRGLSMFLHPPYSPYLAPSSYHLFPGLKKKLKFRHFSSDAEVIVATETWLDGQHSEFFFNGLQTLQQRTKMFFDLRWEYVELIPSLVTVVFFPSWSG